MKGKEKALIAAATPFFIAVCIGLTTGTWDAALLGMAAAGLFAGVVVYFTPNSVENSQRFTSPSEAKKDDVFRR